ncbi:hypothetical protein PPSIR1_27978 [Plesiocystis pacifica SIR-1]|uniref:YCII-related domain-containing protein n=1 Tax=Plesiocystis pacifica SIR-1 TaxID=391625 RepID=A6FZL8_9BACT|nr:YciI family protein [Plesiocystis pacifica]EDM80824.1 hypothetical protein PPSIR1_27978 [Plesiocystis pacifica SIR-1]
MQFLLLIYENESIIANRDEQSQAQVIQAYAEYTKNIKDSGNYVGGDALEPVATATSVRIRGGERTITDGPFAETAEQLGGYYMVEAANLDEAIELAAGIPAAKTGCIEVRPVMVWN